MYSLRLTCSPDTVDELSTALWEHTTAGIRELDDGDDVILIAGFETNAERAAMLRQFAAYSPEWEQEDATDWVQETRLAWPPRLVGERLFLAAPWSTEATPPGRLRIVHNPGLACGTGEHPCTQLALAALERRVSKGSTVIDIGTGSGMLALTALRLGARRVLGMDLDVSALQAARENFQLNQLEPALAAGSADSIRELSSDLTVANISGTVLLSMMDELQRMTKVEGSLILTGFPESELPAFVRLFPHADITALNEWRCIETPRNA